MSSVKRDMVEGYEDIARDIQHFLWEGKPFKSKKKVRTKEELEEKLLSIRSRCWENYDSGSSDLGWRR